MLPALLLSGPLFAQPSAAAPTTTTVCPSTSVTVTFNFAAWTTSTSLSLELSDANGNFPGTILSSVTPGGGVSPGSISGNLGAVIPSRSYRLRVSSVSPAGSAITNSFTISGDQVTAIYPNPLGPYCVGDPISVSYTLDCNFISANTFALQLSNASGSFAAPINIAAVNSVANGTITGNFPNVPAGNGYRMRIVSSNPAGVVSNLSSPFPIGNGTLKNADMSSMKANGSIFCQGESLNLLYEFNATDPINAGNIYTIQLSNDNFATFRTIGRLASTAKSGAIQAVIPYDISGNNYKIRIVASTGPLEGCEYGLYNIPSVRPTLIDPSNSFVCLGSPVTFSTNSGFDTYQWQRVCSPAFTNTTTPASVSIAKNGVNVYVATAQGLVISRNGGATYPEAVLTTEITNDVFVSGSNVYVSTDQGLYVSNNNGSSFPTLFGTGNGIPIAKVRASVATSNGGNDYIYAATTSGLSRRINSNSFTTVLSGVSVADIFVESTNVYVATNNGVYVSNDNGTTFSSPFQIANGLLSNNITAIFFKDGIMYAGTDSGISISTNGGLNWVSFNTSNSELPDNLIQAISVANNFIYVATPQGLAVTNLGGDAFTTISVGLQTPNIYGIVAEAITNTVTSVFLATPAGVGSTVFTLNGSLDSDQTFNISLVTPADSWCRFQVKVTENTCSLTSNQVRVADIPPIISLSKVDPTTCNGQNGTITVSDLVPMTKYQLIYSGGAVGSPASGDNVTTDASGQIVINGLSAATYSVNVVSLIGPPNPGCASNVATTMLTDPIKPSLTLGTITPICAGATSFTIPYTNPTQSPNQYSISGAGISSTTNGSLSNPITVNLSPAAAGSSLSFTLTVKNGTTGCVSDDIMGSVTVDPVSVGGSISGSTTVCSGTNSTVLTLSGQTGSIQKWQSSLSSNFSGATDISNTTTELTASNLTQTTYYRALVKNGVCSQTTSATATVTVDPVSVGGSISGSTTVCSGTNSTVLTLSGQTGSIQKWQLSLSSDFSGVTDISNTTTELTASNLTQTTYYRALVKSGVCSQTTSATATVTVDPVSVGGSISGSTTVCSGTNSTVLTLSGQTGNVQKWQSSLSSDFSGATDISNTTTELTASNLTQTTYYRAIVQNGVCSQTTSATATVTVDPVSVGGSISGSTTVCSGTNSTVLTLSGQTGNVQRWQSSLSSDFSGATDISNTTTELTASNLTQTIYYRAIVQNGVCSQTTSATATVTVDPVSVGGSLSGSTTVCSGTNSTVLTLSGQTGSIQKWQSSLSSDFSGVTDISNTTTELTASNLTQTTYYRALVKSGVCSQTTSATATVAVDPVSVGGSISGSTTVCSGINSTVLTLSGQVGNIQKWQSSLSSDFSGAVDISNTTTGLTASNLTQTTYYRAIVKNGTCSQANSALATVQVQSKPTITLTTLQQTLNEGNSQTFCDTDANPVNGLQFTVSGSCVTGSPVWRVQVGSGSWSNWSPNAPVSQSSNNQPHRYQAACDASCPVTYTNPIELTINYRASVPQNVSLLVDGVTVAVGETKEVCSLVNMPLTFTTNCGANEVVVYSVDGGEYSAGVPVGLVDNQYHNYRVRCRQSGGTVSCVESESGVMRLKLVVIPSAPMVSLSSTSSCDATASFSGQSTCGSLRTVWYNASTNVALPSLPATVPSQTTSYYARCQTENGCVSEKSNVVTFTLTSGQAAPVITVSQDIVCTGTTVRISANCPTGSQTFWNTGVTAPSFEVAFSNVTKQSYWAKCLFEGGCQSAESVRKDVYWNAFVVTLINIGESKSSVKVNDRAAWSSQFITRDGGPELEQSTQVNPTLYFVENANKMAPRYWTINVEACGLSTDGSLTFDMLATPEMGVIRSFNTHENNAPYFMYANREGWTELYAQNHPAYGFYQDNGAGGNSYDAGLPKGLYKLGIRYWDQKGWGSIYPSTRKPQGNVLAYQEYWFRIQSKDGVGVGAARQVANGSGQVAKGKWQGADNGKQITDNGAFANVMPNPVMHTLRLKVQNSQGKEVTAELLDAAGRRVLGQRFVAETNQHQEEFEVSDIANGMYFLRVNAGEKQVTLKVIKVE
ncbi:T9SS type A sorting domain-containing protein [Runella sp. SP2]|uniref:T9SS type A sorting domain-containing protein n=1 Tax=Runella sp. SP2 TaxID=2268026 RepID=UPI0013DE6F71|nr:T9SS type A sorting domain-containing protein [Runella sp. SP2]